MLDRHVRQVFPAPTGESPEREYLSAYLSEPNIVLLGDPGSGKSHTFREAASDAGGTIVTARQFLLLPSQELASPLFIDALDERRAGRSDNDIIDQIVGKLFATVSGRVRISCRDRDWLGDTDLSAFRTYFDRNGGVLVLQLLDLSEDEQRNILISKGITSPEAFLKEANERGLSEFLTNPQNLLMLVEVAEEEGGWPTTFKELFERYTDHLLSEANKAHSGTGLGKYSPGEIADVAGAICALRLISDVEGVSLENNTSKAEFPSYRTIKIADQEKVQAALTRRLFTASTETSAVSYTHRTTAEFLAAKMLAKWVRNGFPIGRLQALLGIDGHPAAELRGLNAWLAVHLPELAVHFVKADPYGVLTYGDAASLTPNSRLALLAALSSATENDPWMRITDLPAARIAPLFADDTASAFEAIIRNGSAPFPLRLLALQAIAAAHGGIKVFSDLERILKDENRSFAERAISIDALMQCGQKGAEAVKRAFDEFPKNTENTLRLKSRIAELLYDISISAMNIATLMASAYECEDEVPVGLFWALPGKIRVEDTKNVLNAFVPLIKRLPKERRSRRITTNLTDAYDRLLSRALADQTITADELSLWLKARESLSEERNRHADDTLHQALLKRKTLLINVARKMIADATANLRPHFVHRIRTSTMSLLTVDELSAELFDALRKASGHLESELFLYDECLHILMSSPSDGAARFEMLSEMTSTRPDMQVIFDSACKPVALPDSQFRRASMKKEEMETLELAKTLEQLRAIRDEVRDGKHIGWTTWFAQIYFAEFSNVDSSKTPEERLASIIGADLVPVALDAIRASLTRSDLPTTATVLDQLKKGRWWGWWHAIIASVDLLWDEVHSTESLSDDVLSAAIAIDVLHPTYEKSGNSSQIKHRDWRREAEKSRSAVAISVYRALAEQSLEARTPGPWGLHEALSENLSPHNGGLALELLKEFPDAEEHSLRTLLDAAKKSSQPSEVLGAARDVLAMAALSPQGRDHWLITGYLVAPSEFQQELISRGESDPSFTWLLRDLSGSGFRNGVSSELSLDQLDCIARIAAKHYPDAHHPSGGWSGSSNAWDAADFVKGLVARISANTSRRGTQVLETLLDTAEFSTYRDYIKHSIANQLVRRREVEYQQPDWEAVNLALENGPPANPADLAALTLHHLRDIASRIASSNSDLYRPFWNEDQYGRVDKPKPEESCRDALLEQLRMRLLPLSVLVECKIACNIDPLRVCPETLGWIA
jgi:hypothetical protein